jgi:hypothetical protein
VQRFSEQSSAADANYTQTKQLYDGHHDLVDHYEIPISQMTMDILLFT